MLETTPILKRCSHCGSEKPVGEYWKSGNHADGLDPYCKDCRRSARRKKVSSTDELIQQIESGQFQVDQKWLLTELITLYKDGLVKDKLRCLEMIKDVSGYSGEENADEKAIVQSLLKSMKDG